MERLNTLVLSTLLLFVFSLVSIFSGGGWVTFFTVCAWLATMALVTITSEELSDRKAKNTHINLLFFPGWMALSAVLSSVFGYVLQSDFFGTLSVDNYGWRLSTAAGVLLIPVAFAGAQIVLLFRASSVITSATLAFCHIAALIVLSIPLVATAGSRLSLVSQGPRSEFAEVVSARRISGKIEARLASGSVLTVSPDKLEPKPQRVELVWLGSNRLLETRVAGPFLPSSNGSAAIPDSVYNSLPPGRVKPWLVIPMICATGLTLLWAIAKCVTTQGRKNQNYLPVGLAIVIAIPIFVGLQYEAILLSWNSFTTTAIVVGKNSRVEVGAKRSRTIVYEVQARRTDRAGLGRLVTGKVSKDFWDAITEGTRMDVLIARSDATVHIPGRTPSAPLSSIYGPCLLLLVALVGIGRLEG